jgi:hypothetical protein
MPATDCGHAYSNALTIPGIGNFPLSPDDVKVSKEGGDKRISVKIGTFVDNITSVRLKYSVTLTQVERSVYESIVDFATQRLNEYYNTFDGGINLNLAGHTIQGGVIKMIDTPAGSYIDTDETEYFEEVVIEIYANSLKWF